MLLLGIDLGTSFIKVSVADAHTRQYIASAQYPDIEMGIASLKKGWAEQSPEMWWHNIQMAIRKLHATKKYNPAEIVAVGIAYQMHGLVIINNKQQVLRDSIIWCDSRAVETGNMAFETIGKKKCLHHLLNSPGNFTASKLAWVKQNEPGVYSEVYKMMLPGDFISMKMTGTITTSAAALSEAVLWDFKQREVSKDVLDIYGLEASFIPPVKNVFANHGSISKQAAIDLALKEGIPVSYKAGDQPNNALSLHVLKPGEVAATAGTSGVIYAVSDQLIFDKESRINSFAHVNYKVHTPTIQPGQTNSDQKLLNDEERIGVLLNINGTGILNKWIKNNTGDQLSYQQMNVAAAKVKPGSDGLLILPFGNGAERMLYNRLVQAHIHQINFNIHQPGHLFRAAQEGIAFAFRYGLDIMRENGIRPEVIRAGNANMFLSDIFLESFVNATGVAVELYICDGSIGAALGAGVGAGIYKSADEAFGNLKPIGRKEPGRKALYNDLYEQWKKILVKQLEN